MSEPAGTIHDLGYKRYVGARSAAGTRWRVIMRNQIATGWKTWWRFKSALGMAVITTFIAGGVMFILSDKVIRDFAGAAAAVMADASLPKAIPWFSRAAFLVSLTIGARVVAGDLQAGAFTFYFARSVRPRDYVLGKLAGMTVLLAMLCLAGPLLLALARLGLAEDVDGAIALLPIIPKALAVGLAATLVFATVPVAFSALLPSARHAVALWAAYYLLFGGMISLVGKAMKSGIGALDLATSIEALALQLFDLQLFRGRAGHLSLDAALTSIVAHVVIATVIIAWQVRRAHGRGVGGAT